MKQLSEFYEKESEISNESLMHLHQEFATNVQRDSSQLGVFSSADILSGIVNLLL